MAASKSSIAKFILLSPLFAAYGALVIAAGIIRTVRWISWTIRLAKGQLRCPLCKEFNSIRGRWQCHAPGCGVTYSGAADRCQRCHASASFFPCKNCGESILLRPGRW